MTKSTDCGAKLMSPNVGSTTYRLYNLGLVNLPMPLYTIY